MYFDSYWFILIFYLKKRTQKDDLFVKETITELFWIKKFVNKPR